MKTAYQLDGLDLEDVVSEIQKVLYLDERAESTMKKKQGATKTSFWNPRKAETEDVLKQIIEIMRRYRLAPEIMTTFVPAW